MAVLDGTEPLPTLNPADELESASTSMMILDFYSRAGSPVLCLIAILLATGCGDRQASSSQPTQTVSAKEVRALKELETKAGIVFPTNSVLINSGDGGGRDPSHGFYEWAVFSPTAIKMPPMKAPGVKDYLNLPLEDTVKFVQSRMGKRKVEQPQAAFTSDWQTNGFGFSGTLVRSVKGDYLVISQGRAK